MYFEHVKSLGFEDRPDYDYLKRLFRELFFKKGFSYDNIYDWDLINAPAAAIHASTRETAIQESLPQAQPPPAIEDEDAVLHEEETQEGRIAGIDLPSTIDAAAQRTYQTAPIHNGKCYSNSFCNLFIKELVNIDQVVAGSNGVANNIYQLRSRSGGKK